MGDRSESTGTLGLNLEGSSDEERAAGRSETSSTLTMLIRTGQQFLGLLKEGKILNINQFLGTIEEEEVDINRIDTTLTIEGAIKERG
jgi:hypothetical protein